MPRFLCLQRSAPSESTPHPDDGGSSTVDFEAAFGSWLEAYGADVADMGGRFGRSEMALPEGALPAPEDGVKGLAGGFMILSADDLSAAVAIARAFPGLVRPGSAVDVIEIREPA